MCVCLTRRRSCRGPAVWQSTPAGELQPQNPAGGPATARVPVSPPPAKYRLVTMHKPFIGLLHLLAKQYGCAGVVGVSAPPPGRHRPSAPGYCAAKLQLGQRSRWWWPLKVNTGCPNSLSSVNAALHNRPVMARQLVKAVHHVLISPASHHIPQQTAKMV